MKIFGLKWERKNLGECKAKKLLGMETGRNLNFDDYGSSFYRKAGRKLVVSACLSKFMGLSESLRVHSWNLNVDIVRLFGCFIVGK